MLTPVRRALGGLCSLVTAIGLLVQLGACRTPPAPDEPQAEPAPHEEPSDERESDPKESDQSDDEE